jgi:hypothetical protein
MDPHKKMLPQRFREGPFRFYEPFIARAVATWPTHIVVKPAMYQLSSETFAARFRDAKLSFNANKWPTSMINTKAYADVGHLLQASVQGDTVLIGSRESVLEAKRTVPVVVEPTEMPPEPFYVGIIGPDELNVLAKLASARLLKAPLSFQLTPMLSPFSNAIAIVESVLADNDVDIVQKDDFYILT